MNIRPVPGSIHVDDSLVDSMIYNIHMYLMKKYNLRVADEDIEPLFWYFRTFKPTDALKWKLVNIKPHLIARKLHEYRGQDRYAVMHTVLNHFGCM